MARCCVNILGFGIQETEDENSVENAGTQCTNCLQLNQELLDKQTRWRELENDLRSTHERAVVALETRLKDERNKRDEVERELEVAKNTIDNMKEEIEKMKQRPRHSNAPVVTQTVESLIRGVFSAMC